MSPARVGIETFPFFFFLLSVAACKRHNCWAWRRWCRPTGWDFEWLIPVFSSLAFLFRLFCWFLPTPQHICRAYSFWILLGSPVAPANRIQKLEVDLMDHKLRRRFKEHSIARRAVAAQLQYFTSGHYKANVAAFFFFFRNSISKTCKELLLNIHWPCKAALKKGTDWRDIWSGHPRRAFECSL